MLTHWSRCIFRVGQGHHTDRCDKLQSLKEQGRLRAAISIHGCLRHTGCWQKTKPSLTLVDSFCSCLLADSQINTIKQHVSQC